jgi:hypothetical protein
MINRQETNTRAMTEHLKQGNYLGYVGIYDTLISRDILSK